MREKKIKYAVTSLLVGLLCMLAAGCTQPSAETADGVKEASGAPKAVSAEDGTGTLEVHFIDVGQGDATLLASDGHFMLIDAGNNGKGTQVQKYLQQQGVETLDYVIGTHPDADHIGGLDVVLYKFDCKTILMPDIASDTRTYDDVVQTMKNKNYTVTNPVVGDTYPFGSASFTIVNPITTDEKKPNDSSVGILVQNGENRFLFTGDAEKDAEEEMLASGMDLSADVYKAAHHGSNTATTEAFFEAVHPDYAVISAGENNRYGHPHAEVLNRFREAGVTVYRTDEQGTIVAVSDGKEITWNTQASDSWTAGEPVGSAVEWEEAEPDAADEVRVFVTETGSKYHAAGCGYLSESSREIPLSEAKAAGKTPCSKCNPPQ